jgi:hypothetical protein
VTPNEYNDLRVLESRIDWITATAQPGYKQAILRSQAERWQTARESEGYRKNDFRWSGYLGTAVDGITWGSREDGDILRLSGECAHQHGLPALTFVSNVSRIDVQVTVQSSVNSLNFAEQALNAAHSDNRVISGMTRTSIIRSTPSGTTTYIGSRSSDRYFRVYDKTAETDGMYPQRSWRYEVEYKQDRAWKVAQHIRASGGSPEAIRQIVEQAFDDYGISLPCLALPPGWRDKMIRQETNDERRLAWLSRCIRPTIAKLAEGIPMEVLLNALGLDTWFEFGASEYLADRKEEETTRP